MSFGEAGNHKEAVAALKRATQLKTDWAQAYRALGSAYASLGDNKQYLEALKEANRLKPADVRILEELGMALRDNRKFVEAIEPLKKVVAARPDDVKVLYVLGNTYLMAGKYDDAIQTLSKVLVMDPDHSEARERLRVSSVRKDLFPKLEALKQNVVHRPESHAARAELADAYKAFGMFAEAEQEFLKALELDPGNFDYKLALCVDYSEWNKVDQSVECYKDVVKRKQHHVLYWSLGLMYERQGNMEQAIATYQKSLELKPEFTFALYGLATAYVKQGRNQEAVPLLQKMLEVEPKNVFANHALGLVYARLGNKTAAMQQYYILQNIDPHAAAELLRFIPK